MTIMANQITELERLKRDILHDWQDFFYRRQEEIDRNPEGSAIASESTVMMNELHELLKKQAEEINDAVTLLVLLATYKHYNKGVSDGMKIAANIGNTGGYKPTKTIFLEPFHAQRNKVRISGK